MNRPSHVLVAYLLSGLAVGACARARERPHADEHLVAALELVQSDPGGALAELKKAKNVKPAQRAYVQGMVFESQKKLAEAEEAFLEATKLDAEGLKPRTALARIQILLGKIDPAVENLRRVIRKDPGSLPAILLLVVCQNSEEIKREARLALSTWPETRPESVSQVPLRAEYFLALASVAKNSADEEAARKNSQSAELGSVPAAITLAKFAHSQSKYSLARDLTRKLVGAEVEAPELEAIAELALLVGDQDAAQSALHRIPGNVRTRSLLLLRGRHELSTRRPKRALAHFSAALGLLKKGDAQGRDELEFWVAQAHRADGDPEEATQVLTNLLKRAPEHRASQLLLSEILLESGKTKEALARLGELAKKHSDDTTLSLMLGDAQMRALDFAAAEASYRKSAALDPLKNRLPSRIADALRGQGKREEAISFLQKLWREHPEHLFLLRAVVGELLGAKKPEEAIKTIEEAAQNSKDRVGVRLLLADTYDTLGRSADVLRTLKALVEEEPESALAWSALARLQQRQRDLSGMETSLRTVLKLSPGALKDKARLATLLQKVGKNEEAARLFAELVESSKTDVVALNNAAMLYAGELNNAERAVEYAELALELAPDLPAVMDTLGWALLKRGKKQDLERAVSLLKRAHGLSGSAEGAFHYGMALMKSGKRVEGRAMIQSALTKPGDEEWRKEAQAAVKE